jgi:hypothetical protein
MFKKIKFLICTNQCRIFRKINDDSIFFKILINNHCQIIQSVNPKLIVADQCQIFTNSVLYFLNPTVIINCHQRRVFVQH